MPRGKLGSIRLVSMEPDGTCVWRVKAEKRAGGRKSITRTIRGTERDARILAAELAKELDSTIETGMMPRITLDEYYYGMYRPWMEESGCTREHIRNVDANYEKHIGPVHGARELSSLSEEEVRLLIKESSAARNTHRYYRAILNKAFEDRYLLSKFDLRKSEINYRKAPRRKPAPWSVGEFRDALERLRGVELVETYMLVASCGMRVEEALAITPAKMVALETTSTENEVKRLLAFEIDSAYTDTDGIKTTKTPESARTATVAPLVQDRLLELIEQTRPAIVEEAPGVWVIRLFDGYTRSRHPRYETRLFKGRRKEVDGQIALLYESGQTKARWPQIEKVADGTYAVRLLCGYDDEVVKRYEEALFSGTSEEARREADRLWRDRRIMPCSHGYLNQRWRRELERAGLRYIPPSSLRSMSETFSARAGIADGVTSKLHGHTTYVTDYNNYLGIGLDDHVEAVEKINALLTDPQAATGTRKTDIKWERRAGPPGRDGGRRS